MISPLDLYDRVFVYRNLSYEGISKKQVEIDFEIMRERGFTGLNMCLPKNDTVRGLPNYRAYLFTQDSRLSRARLASAFSTTLDVILC